MFRMGPWLPSFRQVNSKLGASFSSLLTMAPLICSSKQWEIQANLIGFTQASPNQQNVQQHVPFNSIMSKQRPNITVSSPRPTPPPHCLSRLGYSPTASTSFLQGCSERQLRAGNPSKKVIFQNAAHASPQNIHREIQNASQQGSSNSVHRHRPIKTCTNCLTYRTSIIC